MQETGAARLLVNRKFKQAPCRSCGRHMVNDLKSGFFGRLAQTACAMKSTQEVADRRHDLFEVAIIRGTGPSRRRRILLIENCRGSTCNVIILLSKATINSDTWRYFGGQ